MIVIYEQNYDDAPIILDSIEDYYFEEYCKYFFDNRVLYNHKDYIQRDDYIFESKRVEENGGYGWVSWMGKADRKPIEQLSEEDIRIMKVNEKHRPETINTSINFQYIRTSLNNFKKQQNG